MSALLTADRWAEYVCPVCWRRVEATKNGMIAGHYHKAGGPCEGSFQPFDIALRR